MLLRTKIFDYFGVYDKIQDINKDANGKGTHERFVELYGKYLDENVLPLVEDLPTNLLDPFTCYVKYLKNLEEEKGVELKLYNVDMDLWRRNTLKYIHRWYEIRGTHKCLQLLLKMLGFDSVINEVYGTYGLDSAITFDDPVRVFDLKCAGCSSFSIDLTGDVTITNEVLNAVREAIAFNLPINAKLSGVTYNGNPLINNLTIAIQIDSNGDLIFINPYDYSFNAWLDSDGNLFFESDFASFYSIDVSGNLIFTS